MGDVDEIIDYIKTLKRGFDKDVYNIKIDNLAFIAGKFGLENDDFHTLFKMWLNLSIPMSNWTSLGVCLIPQDMIEERTVDYALRWMLAMKDNSANFPKIAFLLDWLTVAMDTNFINMQAMDYGYEIFFSLLTYEFLASHAIKLVYTLTKPADVTRNRVLEILDFIKVRVAKRTCLRQLQVILGLFKSYKPEFVPEDVPAISIHMAFKKLNNVLMAQFHNSQERRHSVKRQDIQHLHWMNPVNHGSKHNECVDPLVPNMEILNVGSKRYGDNKLNKTYLDFADATSLIHYSLNNQMSRPAKLRALLCNETGIILLTIASPTEHSFFMHDIYTLLNICFLDKSPYSYIEKQDLLQRLGLLQQTLMQGIPVITRFLAQYLPLWNERDYFGEILDLVEWISVDNPNQVSYITQPLIKMYHRAQPVKQCYILRSLTNAYTNLINACKRSDNFMDVTIPPENYTTVLQTLAADISDMCDKELQINPDNICTLYTSIRSSECRTLAEIKGGVALGALAGKLTLALPVICNSAHLLNNISALLVLYKNLFKSMNRQNIAIDPERTDILRYFTEDLANCLYKEEAISERAKGFIFNAMHPVVIEKLKKRIPDVDNKFSIRNSLAFMPYVPLRLANDGYTLLDNKFWFTSIVENTFKALARFLKTVVPDLRRS